MSPVKYFERVDVAGPDACHQIRIGAFHDRHISRRQAKAQRCPASRICVRAQRRRPGKWGGPRATRRSSRKDTYRAGIGSVRLCCRPATPAHSVELADTLPGHGDAFRNKQRPLEHLTSTVSADSAAGPNHAMARHVGLSAVPHDVANRAPRARPPGEQRDVTVSGDPARWDAADDREHASAEIVRASFHVRRLAWRKRVV